jgi:hypothetical protein
VFPTGFDPVGAGPLANFCKCLAVILDFAIMNKPCHLHRLQCRRRRIELGDRDHQCDTLVEVPPATSETAVSLLPLTSIISLLARPKSRKSFSLEPGSRG